MDHIFIPHELKTVEVDTEKRIFRVNGEDFGKGCTGFRIDCHRYDEFDIRVEIDTTVRLVSIRGGKCVNKAIRKTNDPWYSAPEAVLDEELHNRAKQADQVEETG